MCGQRSAQPRTCYIVCLRRGAQHKNQLTRKTHKKVHDCVKHKRPLTAQAFLLDSHHVVAICMQIVCGWSVIRVMSCAVRVRVCTNALSNCTQPPPRHVCVVCVFVTDDNLSSALTSDERLSVPLACERESLIVWGINQRAIQDQTHVSHTTTTVAVCVAGVIVCLDIILATPRRWRLHAPRARGWCN